MGWRDFKLSTPIDKIDKNDKNQEKGIFVDKVDIVDRVNREAKATAPLYCAPPALNTAQKNHCSEVSPEAERATLQALMCDMVHSTCQQIIEDYKARGIASYKSTPENQWAENEISRLYHAVLDGKASMEDFKQACEHWLDPIISYRAISKSAGGGNDTK